MVCLGQVIPIDRSLVPTAKIDGGGGMQDGTFFPKGDVHA